jgi:hypothetical protein
MTDERWRPPRTPRHPALSKRASAQTRKPLPKSSAFRAAVNRTKKESFEPVQAGAESVTSKDGSAAQLV